MNVNEDYIKTPGFSAGHAFHLQGKDRKLFRLLEILPGALSWGTILIIVIFSIFKPVWAAFFIIAFDLYWLLKTIHLSYHHRHNWKRLLHNIKVDWQEQLEGLSYDHIYHMVILPFYKEGREVVEGGIESLLKTKYDKKKIIVVLAAEERAGEGPWALAQEMKEKYGDVFAHFLITRHPADIVGEMAGKGSNISYAAEQSRIEILDKYNIPYEDVLVSAFDVDTIAIPKPPRTFGNSSLDL